jgi:hypothetical protein
MDDRALLLRYMAHVLESLGTTFIDAPSANIEFTAEERAELRKLEIEARVLLRR